MTKLNFNKMLFMYVSIFIFTFVATGFSQIIVKSDVDESYELYEDLATQGQPESLYLNIIDPNFAVVPIIGTFEEISNKPGSWLNPGSIPDFGNAVWAGKVDIDNYDDDVYPDVYIIKEDFTLPCNAVNISIDAALAADNYGWLYVNGEQILSPKDTGLAGVNFKAGNESIKTGIELDQSIFDTNNTITVEIHNGYYNTSKALGPVGALYNVEITYDLATKTVPLLAGQTTPVGEVTVTPVGDGSFDVCYSTSGDWVITELHLAAGCNFSEIETNRACNPQIGLFDKVIEGLGSTNYQCENVFPECTSDCGVFFAAHAVVYNPSTDVTETAWGAGSGFVCDEGSEDEKVGKS